MKRIAVIMALIALCSSISGCTTLQESRGDLLEDTRKLFFDIKNGLINLNEKTFIIRRVDRDTLRRP